MKYLLGVSRYEVRRLDFQERVWGWMTRSLLDRVGVRSPWHCLDVGAGIGCVTIPLARRILPRGQVTALEPSPGYAAVLKERARRADLSSKIKIEQVPVQKFLWNGPPFDFILCRWVFLFIQDIESSLRRLVPHLRPGGYLAVEDYHNYSGMAFYPETLSRDKITQGARVWFRKNGGGLDVAGRLPAIFQRLSLKMVEFRPNTLVGNGKSDLFQWQWLFFDKHLDAMVSAGGISRRDAENYRREQKKLLGRSHAWFVSPIIFDAIGRKST